MRLWGLAAAIALTFVAMPAAAVDTSVDDFTYDSLDADYWLVRTATGRVLDACSL